MKIDIMYRSDNIGKKGMANSKAKKKVAKKLDKRRLKTLSAFNHL